MVMNSRAPFLCLEFQFPLLLERFNCKLREYIRKGGWITGANNHGGLCDGTCWYQPYTIEENEDSIAIRHRYMRILGCVPQLVSNNCVWVWIHSGVRCFLSVWKWCCESGRSWCWFSQVYDVLRGLEGVCPWGCPMFFSYSAEYTVYTLSVEGRSELIISAVLATPPQRFPCTQGGIAAPLFWGLFSCHSVFWSSLRFWRPRNQYAWLH